MCHPMPKARRVSALRAAVGGARPDDIAYPQAPPKKRFMRRAAFSVFCHFLMRGFRGACGWAGEAGRAVGGVGDAFTPTKKCLFAFRSIHKKMPFCF